MWLWCHSSWGSVPFKSILETSAWRAHRAFPTICQWCFFVGRSESKSETGMDPLQTSKMVGSQDVLVNVYACTHILKTRLRPVSKIQVASCRPLFKGGFLDGHSKKTSYGIRLFGAYWMWVSCWLIAKQIKTISLPNKSSKNSPPSRQARSGSNAIVQCPWVWTSTRSRSAMTRS